MYDFTDHEMDNPKKLTAEEENKRGDPRYDQDLDFLPSSFSEPQEALDTYNELGYPLKL